MSLVLLRNYQCVLTPTASQLLAAQLLAVMVLRNIRYIWFRTPDRQRDDLSMGTPKHARRSCDLGVAVTKVCAWICHAAAILLLFHGISLTPNIAMIAMLSVRPKDGIAWMSTNQNCRLLGTHSAMHYSSGRWTWLTRGIGQCD